VFTVNADPMASGSRLVRVGPTSGTFRYMVIPAAPWERVRMTVILSADGWDADAYLSNPTADQVVRNLFSGRLAEVRIATGFPNLYGAENTGYVEPPDGSADIAQLEYLLRMKIADPIGAAVGAYALLRLGELDRLHDWTENLRKWSPWLPEGSAIRGEHLARLGEHEAALAAFLEVPARGLPVFADGLTFALNRLELYATVPGDETAMQAARAAAARLRPVARHIDFSRPITTFTADTPNLFAGG
jgi:hypothetical protein